MQHTPEELEKINEEIENQLKHEGSYYEEKKEKKAYLSIRFWVLMLLLLFVLIRIMRVIL